MTELTQATKAAVPNLKRIATRFRRHLEELSERHEVTPGLTPEGKADELQRILAEHHDAARSIQHTWAQKSAQASATGEQTAETPDFSLVARITAVRTLAEANALVATFEEN
ncbi:hypothetical protein GCM10010458_36560 [Microbacterium luteolum]|uniref:Uncharacterized protein n=1 Tax=Microbacterium luteolum TaxID=69367 RepID=A0ABY7XK90_MICLT|nr:hypothetical protein [Microbacterium luteolum]WDM42521.1 hypothetical protein KV395_04210 [Microbacterium luteolum]